jgi:hypothetical protein
MQTKKAHDGGHIVRTAMPRRSPARRNARAAVWVWVLGLLAALALAAAAGSFILSVILRD